MGKIAFVFSGQGAQYPGMGKSLYESEKAVRELYDSAEKIRPGTIEQSFYGSDEDLKNTENTQPCLYLADLGAAIALKEKGIMPKAVAGFSLGEVAALAFADAYSYSDGFRIVCERGKAMGRTCNSGKKTAMCAVLRLSSEKVCELCKEYEKLYPVNFNCPGQVSVSGLSNSVEALSEKVANNGGRTVPLAVSGAFHSPFMAQAAAELSAVFSEVKLSKPAIPVYSNLTAEPYGEDIAEYLKKQLQSPVLWQKTIENLISEGFTEFVEVGVGKTLCGLIKKISKDVSVYSVENTESLEKVYTELCQKGLVE